MTFDFCLAYIRDTRGDYDRYGGILKGCRRILLSVRSIMGEWSEAVPCDFSSRGYIEIVQEKRQTYRKEHCKEVGDHSVLCARVKQLKQKKIAKKLSNSSIMLSTKSQVNQSLVESSSDQTPSECLQKALPKIGCSNIHDSFLYRVCTTIVCQCSIKRIVEDYSILCF